MAAMCLTVRWALIPPQTGPVCRYSHRLQQNSLEFLHINIIIFPPFQSKSPKWSINLLSDNTLISVFMTRCLCCGRIFSWDENFNVFQLINKRKTVEYLLWETDNNFFFLTLNGWNIWAFKLIKHWNESFTLVNSGGGLFFLFIFTSYKRSLNVTLDWTWWYILFNKTS